MSRFDHGAVLFSKHYSRQDELLACLAMRAVLVAACCVLLAPTPSPAQIEPVPGDDTKLIDRILAVVDDDPIFYSDVELAIELGLVQRREGERDRDLERRTLDGLIDQRLRYHEVDRHGLRPVSNALMENQMTAIRGRFPDALALRLKLEQLGLDEQQLRFLVERQLRIESFVQERLGPRVFVGLEDIQTYYDGDLRDALAERGEPLPPLPEVREQIRQVLREYRLNEAVEDWTQELRQQADLHDHFERSTEELPPVVRRLGRQR